jgi:micrococcal nuclease
LQGCFTGVVSQVVDGDTLDVRSSGTNQRVRLVLVDAPERDTAQGPAATQHLIALCPVSSSVAVLPDASQPRDDYGRTLAVIYCGARNANEDMIRSGRAKLYRRFCGKSAFGKQDWARELGCR